MKKLSIIAILLAAAFPAMAQSQGEYVPAYTRADGTYVPGYYRSRPNNTPNDNYGYQGNQNPYTGATGTRHVEYTEGQRATYQGREVIFQNGQWHYVQ